MFLRTNGRPLVENAPRARRKSLFIGVPQTFAAMTAKRQENSFKMFYKVDRRCASSPAKKIVKRRRSFIFLVLVMWALVGAAIFAASGPKMLTGTLDAQSPKSRDRQPAASAGNNAAQKNDVLVGANFRISQISAVGSDRDAATPHSAYNAEDNEYLVVWSGNGLSGTGSLGVTEVFGRRVNAATGAPVGADFRISNMSDAAKDHAAYGPKAVYNSTSHEYLVVWHGQGGQASPDATFEIYGQRLSRAGAELEKDFRISTTTDLGKIMGSFVRASSHADVAWNSTDNQYLVVWDAMGQPEEIIRTEVFGQLLNATGVAVGKNFRISNTNDQGAEFNAVMPALAYNSKNNQYMVVWTGPSKNKSQNEIWAQALSASGAQVGKGNGDFLVSQVSTNIGSDRDSSLPQVAYNSSSNEYLVVFQANAVQGVDNVQANEVFGQRIDAATLLEKGPNDFRISNTPGSFMNRADNPRVAFNSKTLEYMVVWRGVRTDSPFEIFGQRVSLEGSEIEADFQISSVLAAGKDRNVNVAAVCSNTTGGEYLAVWEGDALPGAAGKSVNEIFGQRLKPAPRRP
jgi:hypothetical protein